MPCPIDEIACVCHLQQQYFCRFFKKNMGKTFLEFVNAVRMYHVYMDMQQTNLSITEISQKMVSVIMIPSRKPLEKNMAVNQANYFCEYK